MTDPARTEDTGSMSAVAVAHRLGHKDATETLKTYAHLWPDDDTRVAALTDGPVTRMPLVCPWPRLLPNAPTVQWGR